MKSGVDVFFLGSAAMGKEPAIESKASAKECVEIFDDALGEALSLLRWSFRNEFRTFLANKGEL